MSHGRHGDSYTPAAAEATWPGGADVAVSLTFDVDGEAGWLQAGAEYERRLSTLSDARYGIVRGLPRILSLLDELEVASTFYIPGDTAVRHARALRAIVSAGHEVGHQVRLRQQLHGDDRPYIERRGDSSLFELPVHWHLDDVHAFVLSQPDASACAAR